GAGAGRLPCRRDQRARGARCLPQRARGGARPDPGLHGVPGGAVRLAGALREDGMNRIVRSAFGALVLIAACHKGGDDEAEVIPKVPVGVAAAVRDTLTEGLSVVGRLMPTPGGSALLTAPAAGVVKELTVQVE